MNAIESVALKTINYRGGLVRFQIPLSWIEEYEEAGGGMFFERGEHSGTLRLNVITAATPAGKTVTTETTRELLIADSQKHQSTIKTRGDGVAILQYDVSSEEGGRDLRSRFWRVAQALPPGHVRIVVFSYTLPEEEWGKTNSMGELNLLDRQIESIELAPVLGITQIRKKPWWRFW